MITARFSIELKGWLQFFREIDSENGQRRIVCLHAILSVLGNFMHITGYNPRRTTSGFKFGTSE